ncbi:MAG: DUF6252 family protein [Gemmatimonas sp.]
MRLSAVTLAACVTLTLVAACSDDISPTDNYNTTGPMSATIGGAPWTANSATALGTSNLIVLNGTRLTTPNYTLSFTLNNVATAGVYPLGVNVMMIGGTVTASSPTLGGWGTPLTGTAGEINITTLTATRIAGSFSFTAAPLTGGSTSNLSVTSGTFDVPFAGTLPVLAANAGSKISATIGTTPFAAGTAAVLVTTGSSPAVSIAANNIERNLSILLSGVSAVGTYPLTATPNRTIQISGSPGNALATWGSQFTGGSGSVTITSFMASRVVGTFTGTLAPIGGGATGNLTITGSFDMGRP